MSLQNVLNGKPTGPDVDKLFPMIKAMSEGDIIARNTIAKTIGEELGTARYRTIVGALKRRVFRELYIELIAVPGVGYEYPKGFDQVRKGTSGMRSNMKQFRHKLHVVAAVVDDRLDTNGRAARDHIVGQAKYIAELAKEKSKSMNLVIGRPEVAPQMVAK